MLYVQLLLVQMLLVNLECPQHPEMLIQLAPQAWLVLLHEDAARCQRQGPWLRQDWWLGQDN